MKYETPQTNKTFIFTRMNSDNQHFKGSISLINDIFFNWIINNKHIVGLMADHFSLSLFISRLNQFEKRRWLKNSINKFQTKTDMRRFSPATPTSSQNFFMASRPSARFKTSTHVVNWWRLFCDGCLFTINSLFLEISRLFVSCMNQKYLITHFPECSWVTCIIFLKVGPKFQSKDFSACITETFEHRPLTARWFFTSLKMLHLTMLLAAVTHDVIRKQLKT